MAGGKTYLTVTALTKYIRYKFDNDVHLTNVLLEGEISNFKKHSRGHFYFTIKDQNAQISATMFYQEAKKVLFEPKDGMKVLVRGSISVYEPQGTYSINILEMEEKGVGSLYLAYEKLKKELEEAGYFALEHKKPIPQFPKAIGVLTSPTGAAVRDCINTIKRRYPLAKIYVYPTLVQGDDAKNSIVKNIELANKQNLVDVLIVGRGGGSIEDLWAFNEKIVAMAIYNSNLPIISAVGHETDFTISDFVADKRAATPTAAAELATPNLENIKEMVNIYIARLNQGVNSVAENYKQKLLHLDKRLESLSPLNRLEVLNQKRLELTKLLDVNFKQILTKKSHVLEIMSQNLLNYNPIDKLNTLNQKALEYQNLIDLKFKKVLENKALELNLYTEKLKVLNPLLIMEKGFSVVYKNNQIVKSKTELETNDIIKIEFIDGIKTAKVIGE